MDMNLIDEIVSSVKTDKTEKSHTHSAIVSRIDDEGVVWVTIAGSEIETPTAETSAEVKKGDRVNVDWRNNKLYISGNVSNPSAGVTRVGKVEDNAFRALSAANNAEAAATSAQESAEAADAAAADATAKAEEVHGIAEQAVADAGRAETAASTAKTNAAQAISDAAAANTAAAMAQAAAEASIEANYRKYNTVSLTQTQIDSLCVHGSVNSWERASAEGYYQGSCNTGDVLLIYVIKPDTTIGKLLVRVTTASSAGQPTTGEAISWDNNINAYFWHDSEGAHVLGDTYRTDVKDGLKIVQNISGNVLANFAVGGATIKSGNGKQIVHFGYGETQGESSIVDAPYYDLGVREANTTKGAYSVAEGDNTKASGYTSHAEGFDTKANGDSSHAEGRSTTASGDSSHAEGGGTQASGYTSHAEGEYTEASGDSSHAEGGGTQASGFTSHAEGYATKASGDSSHAQGKYNVDNSDHVDIVGNGTSDSNRSNAYALDWDGNGYFMGDVYVGCNADSSGGTKLAKVTDCPFPVNGIYMSMDSADPSTIWSGTTWSRISQGKVLVGVDETDSDFAANTTGGEKTHKLTSAESGLPAHGHGFTQPIIPNHTHNVGSGRAFVTNNGGNITEHKVKNGNDTAYNYIYANDSSDNWYSASETASSGGGGACTGGAVQDAAEQAAAAAHNNMPPYLTCYIWLRTA